MGKGDRKTWRGKIFVGSFGKYRPKRVWNRRMKQLPPDIITTEKSHSKPSIEINRERGILKEWFQPKSYVHLSQKLTLNDLKWVEEKVKDESWVSNYSFYPLIHRVVIQRRFKRCSDGKKAHFDQKQNKSNEKSRHIFYANHLDSAIYAYYAKVVLGELYEQEMAKDSELSDCVSAYRVLKVNEKAKKGKSNIHFAKEVFDFIKSQPECVALAFDITGFFDNLDHGNLKKAWAKLLGASDFKLKDDHFNIFKSLTHFSFIEEPLLLKLHGLQAIINRKKLNRKLEALESYSKGRTGKHKNKYFRNEIVPKLIASHSKYEGMFKVNKKGIPQGTPISAFLANLYLLDFDKKVLAKVKSIGGFYRRYSDDIMVVCPPSHEIEINNFILELIASQEFALEINPSKTERSYFKLGLSGIDLSVDKPIRYLGFEFDGSKTLIKSSALSKHHRRKKFFIKARFGKTINMKIHKDKSQKIWLDEIWRKYSSKGKRNFLTYVKRAALIMKEKAIFKQVRKHRIKLNKYINQQAQNRL